jgi:uncharacterized protein YerC
MLEKVINKLEGKKKKKSVSCNEVILKQIKDFNIYINKRFSSKKINRLSLNNKENYFNFKLDVYDFPFETSDVNEFKLKEKIYDLYVDLLERGCVHYIGNKKGNGPISNDVALSSMQRIENKKAFNKDINSNKLWNKDSTLEIPVLPERIWDEEYFNKYFVNLGDIVYRKLIVVDGKLVYAEIDSNVTCKYKMYETPENIFKINARRIEELKHIFENFKNINDIYNFRSNLLNFNEINFLKGHTSKEVSESISKIINTSFETFINCHEFISTQNGNIAINSTRIKSKIISLVNSSLKYGTEDYMLPINSLRFISNYLKTRLYRVIVDGYINSETIENKRKFLSSWITDKFNIKHKFKSLRKIDGALKNSIQMSEIIFGDSINIDNEFSKIFSNYNAFDVPFSQLKSDTITSVLIDIHKKKIDSLDLSKFSDPSIKDIIPLIKIINYGDKYYFEAGSDPEKLANLLAALRFIRKTKRMNSLFLMISIYANKNSPYYNNPSPFNHIISFNSNKEILINIFFKKILDYQAFNFEKELLKTIYMLIMKGKIIFKDMKILEKLNRKYYIEEEIESIKERKYNENRSVQVAL